MRCEARKRLPWRLSMRSESRLAVALRRESEAEGSSALVFADKERTFSVWEGGGGASEGALGLLSWAKCRLWGWNWHCMHLDLWIGDFAGSCCADLLGGLIVLIESG